MEKYHGVSLFSAGLDSILAVKLIQDQGLRILGLHFTSPFFNKTAKAEFWSKALALDIRSVDLGEEYAVLLKNGPKYGFGSVLNPCVDCKILMMTKARRIMEEVGGQFIVSGEVLGQRPMSQRRDTLNVISRDAQARDLLLRPLCARHMNPVAAELSGLVDRERLKGFSGRGRKDQLALAKEMLLPEIPTPAGGCMLTEKENACRYWPVLEKMDKPTARDFELANIGRQLWLDDYQLIIGRNQDDNQKLENLAGFKDILLKTIGFPGPLSLIRRVSGLEPQADVLALAARLIASYSPKARTAFELGQQISVRLTRDKQVHCLDVSPERESSFAEPDWEEARAKIRALSGKNPLPRDEFQDIS